MEKQLIRLEHLARLELRALKSSLKSSDLERIQDALSSVSQSTDVYGIIAGHHNSDRALLLIRNCAPFLYPATSVEDLSVSVETWQKKVIVLEYGSEPEDNMRLFWSPLEMLYIRATLNEKLGILSYLVGETKNIVQFDKELWEFSLAELQKNCA